MTVKVKRSKVSRITQGDIYKDIDLIEYAVEQNGIIEFSKISFPYVIVLTQDCDLNQDYRLRWSKQKVNNHDKKLFSVIVAPIYNSEHVFEGTHLEYLEMEMLKINKNKTHGKDLMNNQNPRYHFIEFPDIIPIPNSIVDFKHYFTVNVEYLKKSKKASFVCSLSPLYRESLSQRYSNFLSRIGLPDN